MTSCVRLLLILSGVHLTQAYNSSNKGVPVGVPPLRVSQLCGKIPPSHVWDVQWSGNSSATMESVIFWDTPYISGVGRLTVEPTDYFTLTKKTGGEYQLKHYSSDDSLKTIFPEGSVKSNADVVFYMARGYNTLTAITKKDYQRWDLANFSNLQLNSSALWLEGACMQQACTTTMGHACVFPFVYEGATYNSCAKSHSGFWWCALDTDASGKYTGGLWGYCSKRCLEIATTTPAPTPAPTPTPAHTPVDLCGKISPSRVWDVQWSGSPSDTEELMSGFNTPYISGVGRLSVEPTDYFTLTKTAGMQYQLKHYSSDDSLKTTFPEGSVKSNPDVVFYMVHGWYGTAITKIEHKRGDSVAFANLKFNPAVLVEGVCRQHTPAPTPAPTLVDVCGKIPPSRVWDVQWSDNPSAIEESLSGFNKPYVSGVGRLSVKPTDYFTLTKTTGTQFHLKHNTLTKKTGTEYQLKHYGSDDSLKTTFPEGSVKANADVVLYIVRGWYATAITKKEHKMWDSDTFSNLQLQPSAWLLEGACMQQACKTRMGDACVFPFVYEGTTYNSCTKARYSSPWCATRTDSHRKYIGKWGVCSNECHLSEPRCGQTTKVGCLGGDEDDCKPFNAACVNNKCVCNSGYCAIASIQNGAICESMSANTTTTVSLQDLLMTATTSTTTIMGSPVCSQMTTARCSHGLFKNFCDFRFRATCDFEVGHCACKPGLCASGRWCVWDRNAETSSLSQIDGEADKGRHAVVEAVMTVTLAAMVLGVMASFAVYLKRHRQSSPGLTPLM